VSRVARWEGTLKVRVRKKTAPKRKEGFRV